MGRFVRSLACLGFAVALLPASGSAVAGQSVLPATGAPAGVASVAGAGTARISATPTNDSYRSYQWALTRLKAEDLRAAYLAAGHTWAELPVVAVLDTGVQATHPDLRGRTVAGYDFVAKKALAAGAATDPNGHGTHVAGIIAATVGNKEGVAGLMSQARIMPVRVMDKTGTGSLENISLGIRWAVDHGAKVINLSLGSPSPSLELAGAVYYADAHGVVVVAASGNSGEETGTKKNVREYPCMYTTVICVGATTSTDKRASFSTAGSQVDVAAPGEDIVSTWKGSEYWGDSGTSMATPFVAAAAAYVRATHPADSAAAVARRLGNTSDDLGTAGPDTSFGAGLINVLRAAQLAKPGTPLAPRSLKLVAGPSGSATVTFAAPSSGAKVTGYRVRIGTRAPTTLKATATSVAVTGLAAGSTYAVSVAALSATGEGRLAYTSMKVAGSA